MSRATISTGSTLIGSKSNIQQNSSGGSCHIAILADFSGREHRGLNDVDSIKQRKIIELDRDNFDEVYARLNVQCKFAAADEPLLFSELDDMHPDFIYQQVPLFNKFIQLKKKLNNKASFADAVNEIKQLQTNRPPILTG